MIIYMEKFFNIIKEQCSRLSALNAPLPLGRGWGWVLVAFLFSGCGDFLEVEPQDKIVLEKFWNEKADVDNVLIGCYSAMQSENVLDRIMVWGEFRSDNIEPGTEVNSDINIQRILNENIDATNGYTTWDGLYDVINRLNTVLLYAPKVSAKDPAYSETMLKATIAEAKALRALCYFYLIRTFRDVPFSTEAYTDDNQKMDVAATSFDEILTFLINDLEGVQNDAMITYPKTQALYKTGRITQQAIHALLCEMYLWKKDYANCVKYADLVIKRDSLDYAEKYEGMTPDKEGRLNGFPLELSRIGTSSTYGSEYWYIFGKQNTSVAVGSGDEVIFELAFMENDNMLQNASVNRFYGSGAKSNAVRGIVAPSDRFVISDNANKSIYTKTDSRYYENLYNVSGDLYGVGKFIIKDLLISSSDPTKMATVSYLGKQTAGHNHANWIIYRLTDIMLLKAEALVEMGADNSTELDEAFKLVQAVNNRSLCESPLSTAQNKLNQNNYKKQTQMRELVLKERQRELMFEGKRWYDLVRRSLRDGNTSVLASAVAEKKMDASAAASQRLKKIDAIFWPYNLEEMRVNHSLKQNPAFSSGENSSYSNTGK